jgi:hypothetical protein
MRFILFVFCPLSALVLAACDTPGWTERHAGVTRIAVADLQFSVRLKAERQGYSGRAIRTNRMLRPDKNKIALIAGLVMEDLTGCRVQQLGGDVAVIDARLRCGATDEAARLKIGGTYDCSMPLDSPSRLLCQPAVVAHMDNK